MLRWYPFKVYTNMLSHILTYTYEVSVILYNLLVSVKAKSMIYTKTFYMIAICHVLY